MILKIALLQLLPGKGLEEQFRIGKAACEKAKDMDADIALFPEMWSDGYAIPQDETVDLEKMLSAGEDFYVADLDTGRGTVKVGSMICFDREIVVGRGSANLYRIGLQGTVRGSRVQNREMKDGGWNCMFTSNFD